jgi:hypothetical protein
MSTFNDKKLAFYSQNWDVNIFHFTSEEKSIDMHAHAKHLHAMQCTSVLHILAMHAVQT